MSRTSSKMVEIGEKHGRQWVGHFSLYVHSGSFPYLAIEKPCKHSRKSHNFCPIIMKVGQNIGSIDISDEFENSRDR